MIRKPQRSRRPFSLPTVALALLFLCGWPIACQRVSAKSPKRKTAPITKLSKGLGDPAAYGCERDSDCLTTKLIDGDCCGLYRGSCSANNRSYNKKFLLKLAAHQSKVCSKKRLACPKTRMCRRANYTSFPRCRLSRCESMVVRSRNRDYVVPRLGKTDAERTVCKQDSDCVVSKLTDGLCCQTGCLRHSVVNKSFARRLKRYLKRTCGRRSECEKWSWGYCDRWPSLVLARCQQSRCRRVLIRKKQP